MKKQSRVDEYETVRRAMADGRAVDNFATPEELAEEKKQGSGDLGSSLEPGKRFKTPSQFPKRSTPRPALHSRR